MFLQFFDEKKNSTHWHIVVVFFSFFLALHIFFFTTKLKIIARKKMRVTDFFGVHLLCVYTNRYALFCVKLRSMCYMFVFSFSFQSAFKYILLCYFRLFYPKTVLHFMPLLYTFFFSSFLYRKRGKINRFLPFFYVWNMEWIMKKKTYKHTERSTKECIRSFGCFGIWIMVHNSLVHIRRWMPMPNVYFVHHRKILFNENAQKLKLKWNASQMNALHANRDDDEDDCR